MTDLYRKVWAPDGTVFEVPPEKASDLVLNKGWSNTAPVAAKKSKKVSKKTEDEAVPAADTTEANEPQEHAAEQSE